jgi:hypothetical protein
MWMRNAPYKLFDGGGVREIFFIDKTRDMVAVVTQWIITRLQH